MNKEEDNSYIFFKLWRNIVIQNQILSFLNLYNNHRNSISIDRFNKSIEEYKNYPYKNYFSNITIESGDFSMTNGILKDLPESCTELTIDGSFTFPIVKEGTLPSQIKTLILKVSSFNSFRIDNNKILPPNLTTLVLPYEFNFPIPNGVLPETLTSIHFGGRFNQQLQPGMLPNSIKELYLGYEYSHSLTTTILPKSLEKLVMTGLNIAPITPGTFSEQSNLNTLVIKSRIQFELSRNWLPENLEYLYIEGTSPAFPLNEQSFPVNGSLKTLIIGKFYEQPLFNEETRVSFIPDSVTELEFSRTFQCPPYYPSGLKKLKINQTDRIREVIVQNLPTTVIEVDSVDRIQDVQLLPSSVEKLVLHNIVDTLINDGDISNSITELVFTKQISQVLRVGSFSSNTNLKSLTFSNEFDFELPENSLPSNLEYLEFGSSFSKFNNLFLPNILPNNLKSLAIHSTFKIEDRKSSILEKLHLKKVEPVTPISLPSNLRALKIKVDSNECLTKVLSVLPSSVALLDIYFADDSQTNLPFLIPSNLPSSITKISIHGNRDFKFELPISSSISEIYSTINNIKALSQNTDQSIVSKLHLLEINDKFGSKIFKKLVSQIQ